MARNNFTLKWLRVEQHLPALRHVCRALSSEIGFGVRSNLYLTPAFSKGFHAHYDLEDALLLQLKHTKAWSVYRELNAHCSRGRFWFADASDLCQAKVISEVSTRGYVQLRAELAMGDATMQFELAPGDALYIPRGWLHEADMFGRDTLSLHVTLGVYLELACDYLLRFVRALFSVRAAQPVLRRVFYVRREGADADMKRLRKWLLKDFEPWLRTLAFGDEALRESVAYFQHVDGAELAYAEMALLFRKYVVLFMRYVHQGQGHVAMYGDAFEQYARQFMEVLQLEATRRKLTGKLLKH